MFLILKFDWGIKYIAYSKINFIIYIMLFINYNQNFQ